MHSHRAVLKQILLDCHVEFQLVSDLCEGTQEFAHEDFCSNMLSCHNSQVIFFRMYQDYI